MSHKQVLEALVSRPPISFSSFPTIDQTHLLRILMIEDIRLKLFWNSEDDKTFYAKVTKTSFCLNVSFKERDNDYHLLRQLCVLHHAKLVQQSCAIFRVLTSILAAFQNFSIDYSTFAVILFHVILDYLILICSIKSHACSFFRYFVFLVISFYVFPLIWLSLILSIATIFLN